MQHPIPFEALSPEIAKLCGPSAPAPAKLMASRGMLPTASPIDLVTVLYMLAHDANETLRAGARSTLGGLPAGVVEGALAGDVDARVIDFVVDLFPTREALLLAALRNPRISDETLERLAGTVGESLLEVIAANETRLLQQPRIIEALYLNRRTRMSTVDRIVELAVRHGLNLEGIPAFREIAAAIEGQIVVEPDEEAAPDDRLFASAVSFEGTEDAYADFDGGAGGGGAFGDFDDLGAPPGRKDGKEGEGKEEDPEHHSSLGFQVSQMTVSQKVRLAILGNASHRALLLRDPNKIVSMAAIKSPSVTDQEVRIVSQSRSVPEEIIRYIADNRDWTKNYTVKCSLVFNPKCPLGQSLRFLPHLRPGDLKTLVGNKNVPQALGVAARQLLQRRPGQG